MNKIIKTIIELIKDNKKILQELNEKDKEFYNFELKTEKLISVFNSYKVSKMNFSGKKIFVKYYGNPYITALICIEGLLNECDITLDCNDICYGINKGIVNIVNTALKECKLKNEFVLVNRFSSQKIKEEKFDEIVCVGDSNSYDSLERVKELNLRNFPLFNINLYYDDENYEELVRQIYDFAMENFYEIEIFDDEEDFEEVLYCINNSTEKYCSVLLSKDKQKQENFQKNVNSKIICINENPFSKFEI